MHDYPLKIVLHGRDVEDFWNVDCLVIDPAAYHPREGLGFKGLRDGESITLGRYSTYGRFDFPPSVSRNHVSLSRSGSEITVEDLGSTNGTFYIRPNDATVDYSDRTTPHESMDGVVKLGGATLPSELHPERNEDALLADETIQAIGVFDGVGGAPGSERASRIAANSVSEHLKRLPGVTVRSLSRTAMHEALEIAHEAILHDSRPHIATTATIAKLFRTDSGTPYVVIASAGDSRAYLYRDGRIEHLTLDHAYRAPDNEEEGAKRLQRTLAQATTISQLSPEARAAFKSRNILSSWLGRADEAPTITVDDFEVQAGDRVIVTSDGVHDNLADNEIEAILEGMDCAKLASEALVQAARERSRDKDHLRAKPDDMTAAILSV